ncbi:MAG: FxsA family protein [Candidatus Omnitrophota bacterium]
MFSYIVLVLTVIPIVELALLIKVGTIVGVGNTILLILATGIAGAYLLRAQGFQILRRIDDDLAIGNVPSEALMDGFLVFCGGLLLITPGIMTDIMGLVLLVPAGRSIVKYRLKQKLRAAFQEGRSVRIISRNRNRF